MTRLDPHDGWTPGGDDLILRDELVTAALEAASPAEPGLDVEARLLLNSALDHDDYVLIHRDDWSRFRTALEALEALP